jgi:hypothetical protein
MLVFGVLVVWQGGAERIVEDSYGFIEGDAMLGKIAGGFGRIELEVEAMHPSQNRGLGHPPDDFPLLGRVAGLK